MKSMLDQYAQFTLWANTRFVERLQQENDAVLDTPVKSSFASIRLTLLHIRDAENAWTARLEGRSFDWPAVQDRSLFTLPEHTSRLCDLVLGQREEDLLASVAYNDLKGNVHAQPRWQMIMHCLDHSSRHRGQVITLMRLLDLGSIPATDLVLYQRSLQK